MKDRKNIIILPLKNSVRRFNWKQGVQIGNSAPLRTNFLKVRPESHQRIPQRWTRPSVSKIPSPPMCKKPLPLTPKPCTKPSKMTQQLTNEQTKRRVMKRPAREETVKYEWANGKRMDGRWLGERFISLLQILTFPGRDSIIGPMYLFIHFLSRLLFANELSL